MLHLVNTETVCQPRQPDSRVSRFNFYSEGSLAMLVCLYSMNCYARKNQPVNRIFDGARERVTVQKQSPYEGKTEGDREEDGVIDEEGDTSHRKQGREHACGGITSSFTHLVVGR